MSGSEHFKLFIYLVALGLRCSRQDLIQFATCKLSSGMWDLVPLRGLNLELLHWEYRVLATGPPEKSREHFHIHHFL